MLTPPNAIVPVLSPFATLFRNPTWLKAQVLLVGAILAPGQRTVAAALRVMGLSDDRNYARYHHVLNRAVWSPLQVAQVLLGLLIQHLDYDAGPLVFGIDETLERRRGAKIKARAIYRDPVRSSRQQLVKASGLRWISLMWLGHVPWAGRHWALPVLTVLAPSTRYYQQREPFTKQRRHKKLTDWARQMVMQTLMVSLPNHAGCRSGRWCWWATTATPCWTCSTAANPSVNPLPSLPDYGWTPLSMRPRQPVSRVSRAARR